MTASQVASPSAPVTEVEKPAAGGQPGTAPPAAGTNDYLDDIAPDEEPAELDPADYDSFTHASWVLRRIGALELERDRISRLFDAEIARIQARRDERLRIIDAEIARRREPLVGFHAALLALDPKRKTIVLPGGTLKATVPQKPRLGVVDAEAFIPWALEHRPDLVHTKHAPDVAKLNTAGALVTPVVRPTSPGENCPVVTADGETIPGVAAWLPAPTYRIEPASSTHPIDQAAEAS